MLKFGLYIFSLLALFSSCSDRELKTEKLDNLFYKKAFQFRNKAETDSAFIYYNKAKEQFLLNKDSIKAGDCLVNMAIISTDQGDLFGGQELSLDALSFFDEENPEHHIILLSSYNNLGIASFNLKQYAKAIEFYNKSLKFITDSAYALIIKNNIANAYRKEHKFGEAIKIYQSILKQEKKPVNHARILSNYAYTKWLQNNSYKAESELHRALSIRIKEKDIWGQNASYAQLADYYMKKAPDSALYFANQMYRVASKLNSADDRLEALQKLIVLSDIPETRNYFDLYRSLDDSLQMNRRTAKNQFALIRYESEKHKSENLILQNENNIRNLWIVFLAILLSGGSVISIIWYKRKRRHVELSTQNSIRKSQLETSKKVHDVVANGIYRIMSEMENNEQADKGKILDQMESLYERSRDISHEDFITEDKGQDFHNIIGALLMSFSTADTKVHILGNTKELWESLNKEDRYELKNILQEILVNMRKHSKASSVGIRFERKTDFIKVYYADNGIGKVENIKFGKGLKNTGNRINSIGGNINFSNGKGGGLNIQIQTPARL